MAGGRAVALVYNEDKAELLRRLRAVSPLIFCPVFKRKKEKEDKA